MSKLRIFISYSQTDALGVAEELCLWLEQRGHKPWIDREGIRPGVWTSQLERALRESDLVIAIISPWSVLPESFLRKETLLAQELGKQIVPIKIADVSIPIHIKDYQLIDGSADSQEIYAELPRFLPTSLSPDPRKLWAEVPMMDFSADMDRHRRIFIGREWLFRMLKDWALDERSRVLLLVADAGVGKSSLATKLNDSWPKVRGIHFCNRSANPDSCRAVVWIAELSRQIANQLKTYLDALPQQTEIDWSKPDSLFRKLIIDPLFACESEIDTDENWVFVVDGLDEAFAVDNPDNAPELASLLARFADYLPKWLRIIATSRPNDAITTALKIDGVRRQYINAEGKENRQDLRAYLESRLGIMKMSEDFRQEALSRLLPAARGNFLFVRIVLDALQTDPNIRLRDVVRDPQSSNLSGLYHVMFNLRMPDQKDYQQQIRPLLECLATAQEPLSRSLLLTASGIDRESATNGLTILSAFLNSSRSGYSLFHKSLEDWLLDETASRKFQVDAINGHRKLASVCLGEYSRQDRQMCDYCLVNITVHLREADMKEKLESLLCDYDFIKRWISRGRRHNIIAALNACFGNNYQKWPSNLRESLEKSRSIQVRLFIAEIHDMAGRHKKAIEICEDLLEKSTLDDVVDHGLHVKLATYLDHEKEHVRSLEVLDDFLMELERRRNFGIIYWWARYHRGITHRRLHRYASAIEDFEAIEAQSSSRRHRLGAQHQLAVIGLIVGDLEEARCKLHRCLEERGDDPNNHRRSYEHRRLGQLHALDGRLDLAESEFSKAEAISRRCNHQRYLVEIQQDLLAFVKIPAYLEDSQPEKVFFVELAEKFDLEDGRLNDSFRVAHNMGLGYLEIFDEATNTQGYAVPWDVAHKVGYIHTTVAVLLVNDAREIAVQRRQERDSHGKWDVSVAGHVEVGEPPELAAIRETYEELGALIDHHLLEPFGELRSFYKTGNDSIRKDEVGHTSPECYVYRTGKNNRELMSVFLTHISEFRKDRGVEIKWLDVTQAGREVDSNTGAYASTFKHLFGHKKNRDSLREAVIDLLSSA